MDSNTRNQTIKRSILCPVCDRKFSGPQKQVNKQIQLHNKVSHPNFIFNTTREITHIYDNKGHFRTDKELLKFTEDCTKIYK